MLDPGVGWMRTNPAEQMTGVWANVDLLIGTLDELQFWTRIDQPEQIAKRARRQGARRVVIKMGADGAAYMDEDENFDHQPACRVARSDVSVGTGDAFNGALLARLVGGESLASAVAFAQTVAAKVVCVPPPEQPVTPMRFLSTSGSDSRKSIARMLLHVCKVRACG